MQRFEYASLKYFNLLSLVKRLSLFFLRCPLFIKILSPSANAQRLILHLALRAFILFRSMWISIDMSRDFTILLNFVINLFLGFFSSNVYHPVCFYF